MEPSTLCLRGGCLRFHAVSGSGHLGDRVTKGLDLPYVVSTSLSSFWGMGRENVGMLAWGYRPVGTEIMLLTTMLEGWWV